MCNADPTTLKTPAFCQRGFMLAAIGVIVVVLVAMRFNRDSNVAGPMTIAGRTMGTTYTVKFVGLPPKVTLDEVQREAADVLDAVNRRMSTYDPKSELSLWNASASTDWFAVSKETAEVVQAARRIGHDSGGALDVTVGPLVNLWHFGPDKRSIEHTPTPEEIEGARKRIGLDDIDVRQEPPAVRKNRPDMFVDLSSIAKGYGVEQVADCLERLGIHDYMVEVGGEVHARGHNAQGQPWQIAVESPTTELGVQRVIALGDASMATSGDYRNYFERDGVRFSHIIDPRTARPIDHRLVSVSVVAPDCTTADGWATALMVAGPDEAKWLAAEHSLAVLLIVKSEHGFEEWSSPQFRLYASPSSKGRDQ